MSSNPYFDALYQAALEASRRRIDTATHDAVMTRDHRACRYCGAPATEIDHVEPWSRGGLTVMGNLVAACQPCNRSKGDRTPEEWQRAEAAKRFAAEMAYRRTRSGRIDSVISRSRQRSRRPSLAAGVKRP